MAGHSKWANIRHKKGAADAKRSKMFSKLSKEISVAAKMGGDNPDMNPRLRLAIANAKSQSVPKDNIANAIKKGAGGMDGADYNEVRYEGYGPNGVAVIVDCLTDNLNRTVGEVRSIFTKFGGNLGESGSVIFQFTQVGEILYPADAASADDMFERAVEAGADDCESSDDGHIITTEVDNFAAARDALEQSVGEAEQAGLVWRPNVSVELSGDKAETMIKMIDKLEDLDDVQTVTGNYDISDDEMEKLSEAV